MMKRIITISSHSFVKMQNKQLLVTTKDTSEIRSVPIEDIGLLEIESLQCTVTSSALASLMESQAAVTFCDGTHHPVGMLLPIEGNTLHSERLRLQIEASKPLLKRTWQDIVRNKISNQADMLTCLGAQDAPVRSRVAKVRSDDATNQEAIAASKYWKVLLKPFDVSRSPEGAFPNNLLNYGYAVLRACVARALVTSGLHPAIGIKHCNRYNAFSLADDIMEPYRPFVDGHVLPYALELTAPGELTADIKRHILQVLVLDTYLNEERRPLMNAVQLSCSSYVNVLSGKAAAVSFPRVCE